MNVYLLRHGVSFYPSLLTFCLQIAYIKVRNLLIGVKNYVGKVLIDLLRHAKPAACTISIISTIIDAPAVDVNTRHDTYSCSSLSSLFPYM